VNAVLDPPDADVLGAWVAARTQRVRLFGRMVEAGLRFAFYGRVSTEDYQDPVSSRRWRFDLATDCVAGQGRITAQYFDIGYSREIAWTDRPEAARLLAAITDPDRGFDAVVIGEYARAFYGSQATHLAPLLREYGGAAVAAGGRRPGRPGQPDPSGAACHARRPVEARGATGTVSHHRGDAGTSPRAGPPSGRAATVRVSRRRRRTTPNRADAAYGRRLRWPGAGWGRCCGSCVAAG